MTDLTTAIDHLAVGAATLKDGVNYIRDALGVDIPRGGEHPHMGTHNHLMQLGEGLFLEVIAINPEGEPPARPRWFGLDDPSVRSSILQRPRLLTWVANTTDLPLATSKALDDYGEITGLSRGDLSWSFALPRDGRLLAAGLLPYLMQWHCDAHPSGRMTDTGCQLESLSLYHPYAQWLEAQLDAIGARHLVTVVSLSSGEVPRLEARIKTPSGPRTLSSAF